MHGLFYLSDWFSVSEFVNTEKNKNIVYERLLTQNDLIDIVKKDKDVFIDEGTFPKGYYDKLIQQTARFYDEYMN